MPNFCGHLGYKINVYHERKKKRTFPLGTTWEIQMVYGPPTSHPKTLLPFVSELSGQTWSVRSPHHWQSYQNKINLFAHLVQWYFSLTLANTFCQCSFQNFLNFTIFNLHIFEIVFYVVLPSFTKKYSPLLKEIHLSICDLIPIPSHFFKDFAPSVIHPLFYNINDSIYTRILQIAYKRDLMLSWLSLLSLSLGNHPRDKLHKSCPHGESIYWPPTYCSTH